ncbi:MAG: glycosyltransferase family 4 protein [Patescibacteria group bacterium]|nr:glycosyltransferase family 4 protein [Patescibacteria group bacterium]
MIKLLGWFDYACQTGFAQVSRNVLSNLHDTGDFKIDVVGINYDGDPYDMDKWVGRVYPAMRGRMLRGSYADVFGRQRVLDLLAENDYDVLFMIQDTFVTKDFIDPVVETCKVTGTKIVYYFPIDSQPHPSWVTDVVSKVHYPITYTQYAKSQCLRYDPSLADRLEVIYHGTNTSEYFYSSEDPTAFRKLYFKDNADKFIIMNLNRNQPRKDILRSLLIQKQLLECGENTFLYLHMDGNDVGGDVDQWAEQLGLMYGEHYAFPTNFGEGVSTELVNQLYNSVDCLLTTTHGEGWGLSLTEAMATKLPIVAPDNTSISEILGSNRGYLIPSGETNNDWYTQGDGDNNRLRPLMNVDAACNAIQQLVDGQKPDVEAAYLWAISQDWATITKQFERIIRKAVAPQAPAFTPNRQQRRKAKVK